MCLEWIADFVAKFPSLSGGVINPGGSAGKTRQNSRPKHLTPKPKQFFFRGFCERYRTKMFSGLPNHLYFCHDNIINSEIIV